jgi:transposase
VEDPAHAPSGSWPTGPTRTGRSAPTRRRRRIKATIPRKSDQQKARLKKGSAGGRPPAFDPEVYQQRNTTERAINRLKAFRAVALRTDKREFVYNGTVDVASIRTWLRHPSNQDP